MPEPSVISAYVDAAAALQGLSLSPEQRERVIKNFGMAAQIISPLLEVELPDGAESAPVFEP